MRPYTAIFTQLDFLKETRSSPRNLRNKNRHLNPVILENEIADLPEPRKRKVSKMKVSTNGCAECGTMESPEWRGGPKGQSSLCNACGLRYSKSLKKERLDNAVYSQNKMALSYLMNPQTKEQQASELSIANSTSESSALSCQMNK